MEGQLRLSARWSWLFVIRERPRMLRRFASWYSCSRVRPVLRREPLVAVRRRDAARVEVARPVRRALVRFEVVLAVERRADARFVVLRFAVLRRDLDPLELFASPDSARCLFTVRAAISSARPSDMPRCFPDALMRRY